jgi:3',5'-cyclic-AMP phosphodiesterase
MKIIQISDTHICKNPRERIFGLVNAEDTFLDVLQLIKQEKPDLILATGDLSHDGSIESYQRLNHYLTSLDCEIYAIYGNHDNPANFDKWLLGNKVKKEPLLKTDIGNFIFLNSLKPGYDSGYVDHTNLQHLITNLEKYNNCIPVIHHHFIHLATLIDDYLLENNTELINILKTYRSKLKFCITGHVHNSYQSHVDGIVVYSSLSTCIQLAKTANLLFENKHPGFILYNFHGDTYDVIEKTT